MNIRELNLIGFGKFKNKKIYFKNGINIIYGENEAGKTTIHNFIDGMFYGFLKPYVRNAIYLDEHERYNPWDNTNYSGIIKFEYFSEDYIIERNFTKSQEATQVLLDSTGEDLTYGIDTGNNGRILQPGFHFFGFNNAVYSNTVSIKQLELKTDNKLANELREKLVNVSSAMDENISIDGAINELNLAIKEIGSTKAPTSAYSKENQKLIYLQEEKEEILSFKDIYEDLLRENSQLESSIHIYNLKIKEIQSRLLNANIIEMRNQYNDAKILKDEIELLQIEAEKYIIYDNLTMDDYSKCIGINNDIEHLEKKIKELMYTLENLDEEINSLVIKNNSSYNLDNELQKDYKYFEKLEDEKNKLMQNNNSNNLEFIKRDYSSNKSKKHSLNILLIISGLLFLTLLIYSFVNNRPGLLITNVFLTMIFTYGIWKWRRVNGLLKRIASQKNVLESLDQENKMRIIENENIIAEIFKKYNVNNNLEFKGLQEDYALKIFKKEQLEQEINKTIETSVSMQKNLESVKKEKDFYKNALKEILERNNSATIDDFKIGLSKKQIYQETLEKIKNKEDLFTRILGNFKLEEISNKLLSYGDYTIVEEELTSGDLRRKLVFLQDELTSNMISKKGIESNLENINQKISNLVNVEEEIHRSTLKINEMDRKKQSLELAKSTIEELSKDIHKQFAPVINERVGKIIEKITDGKYQSVKIDSNLELGVNNPITGELINVNKLSGGTIDQLYFALRFGIIKSMADNKLPLILDDCFIQYDDIRLENILRFLVDTSKDRQIILFTCQKREMELLDKKIGIDYNLINLNI